MVISLSAREILRRGQAIRPDDSYALSLSDARYQVRGESWRADKLNAGSLGGPSPARRGAPLSPRSVHPTQSSSLRIH
jgi:hypothetical protein